MSAANFNIFKVAFRDFVLASGAITALIGTRFFGAQLATFFVEGTDLPLATFSPLAGSDQIFLRNFPIRVTAYSNVSFDEAHDVFDVIRERIFCVKIDPKFLVRIVGTPIEDFDEVSRLYAVSATFTVNQIL